MRYREVLAQAKRDPKRVLEATKAIKPAALRSQLSGALKRKAALEKAGRAGSLNHQYYTIRSCTLQRLLDFRLATGSTWRDRAQCEQEAQEARGSTDITDCVELQGQALLAEQAARPQEPHRETSRRVPLHTLDDARKLYATAVSDPKAGLESISRSSRGKTKGWGSLLRSALSRNRRQQQTLNEAGEGGSEAYQGHILRALAFEKLLEYWSATQQQSRSEQQGDKQEETQLDVNATVADQVDKQELPVEDRSPELRSMYAQFHV